ncbi:monothiol glutaredoxin-S11-like [Solanum stenotomum]|uniref:monothiol glutaredoxin-S11-like n=1 Tax=Solanum stenotomum TaxID=172797 RepID=UPI0020CFED9F|nr:monothiol glutaredoxin-S11-like [Solanum stenotomum]
MDKVQRMTREHGVLIFSKSTCCLSYAVSILFQDLGVIPYVCEIDLESDGKEMEKALIRMGVNSSFMFPVVFIGGLLVGSTNEVMSLHLQGSLIKLIKPYISVLKSN